MSTCEFMVGRSFEPQRERLSRARTNNLLSKDEAASARRCFRTRPTSHPVMSGKLSTPILKLYGPPPEAGNQTWRTKRSSRPNPVFNDTDATPNPDSVVAIERQRQIDRNRPMRAQFESPPRSW